MNDNAPTPKTKDEIRQAGESFKYSASQIATQRDCFTKWFLDQTLNFPRQDTAATALGKKIHGELEAWLRDRVPPSHPRAKALIPFLPLPSPDLKVEHEIRLLTPPGVVRGFIDLFILDPEKVQMPEGFGATPGVPVVKDHKTTSNIYYAKTVEDLKKDPQAILYGLAARLEARDATGSVPENVDLNWNYVQTRGDPETKSVRLRQSLTIMEDGLGPIIEEAAKMRATLVSAPDAKDLPHDLRSCEKFGGCQFIEVCPHVNKETVTVPETADQPVSATLAKIRALQAKKITPPPPAEAAPPPTPEPPTVTPEPKLEAIPTDKVEESSTPVEVLPPDAPPPKKRRKAEVVEVAPANEDPVETIRRAVRDLIPRAKNSKHFFAIGAILEYCEDFVEGGKPDA